MSVKMKEKKRIQVQLDKDVAEKAESIIEELGMTPTTAINIFYKRVIANDGIPFDVHLTERERVAEWLNDDDWE